MNRITVRQVVRTLGACAAVAATSAIVSAVPDPAPVSAQEPPVAGEARLGVPPEGTSLITEGGSGTPFVISAPGAQCSGDSASGGYQVNTYIVPASVDPASLTFTSDGPVAPGGVLALPLFQAVGESPVVGVLTDIQTGLVLNIPAVSFAAFAADPSLLPPGEYNIGFACWQTNAPTFLDRYWNVRLTFTADASDQPVGFTWEAAPGTVATTTTTVAASTTTTTTSAGAATTTTTTSTTVVGGTTTVAGGSTTTTLAGSGFTTTTFRFASGAGAGAGTGGGTGGSGTSIPTTGSEWVPIAVWATLLIALGRMVVLAARRVPVIGPDGTEQRRR